MRHHVIVAILSCVCYVHSNTISSVQTYHTVDESGPIPVEQDIEVNVAQDVAVFRMSGEESRSDTAVVVDYGESVTGVYDAEAQSCYLAAGVPTDISSASELKDTLDADATQESETPIEGTLFYSVTNDAPVQDASLVPETLREACAGLPLLWMEPSGSVESVADGETDGEESDDAAAADLQEVAESAERVRRIPPPERWSGGVLRPYFPPGLPESFRGTRDGPRPAADRPRPALLPYFPWMDRPQAAQLPALPSQDREAREFGDDDTRPEARSADGPRASLLPYRPWADSPRPAQIPYFRSDDRPQAVQLPARPSLDRKGRNYGPQPSRAFNGDVRIDASSGSRPSYDVSVGYGRTTGRGHQLDVKASARGEFGRRPNYGISASYTYNFRGRRSVDPGETGGNTGDAIEGDRETSLTGGEVTDGKSAEKSNDGKSGGSVGGRVSSGRGGDRSSERGSRWDRWRAAWRNRFRAAGREDKGGRGRWRGGQARPADVLPPGCKFVCSYIDRRRICIEKCE